MCQSYTTIFFTWVYPYQFFIVVVYLFVILYGHFLFSYYMWTFFSLLVLFVILFEASNQLFSLSFFSIFSSLSTLASLVFFYSILDIFLFFSCLFLSSLICMKASERWNHLQHPNEILSWKISAYLFQTRAVTQSCPPGDEDTEVSIEPQLCRPFHLHNSFPSHLIESHSPSVGIFLSGVKFY